VNIPSGGWVHDPWSRTDIRLTRMGQALIIHGLYSHRFHLPSRSVPPGCQTGARKLSPALFGYLFGMTFALRSSVPIRARRRSVRPLAYRNVNHSKAAYFVFVHVQRDVIRLR